MAPAPGTKVAPAADHAVAEREPAKGGGSPPLASSRSFSRAQQALLLTAVVLAALNLRPFLTAIGPLAGAIAADTGLDLRGIAWLTLLPMLLMGLGAWAGPVVQQWLGARRLILSALSVLAAGCALRAWPGGGLALVGTAALCGLGVAFVQAVMPGVIKARFPGHVSPVMGVYSAALMGGGALGAQLTPLWAQGGAWRGALAAWVLPVLASICLAWWVLPRTSAVLRGPGAKGSGTALSGAPAPARASIGWMLRRRRTWVLMACFGLVNAGYASAVAWLAPYYQSHGWSAADSGTLVALMALAQAAAALVLPALAARRQDRRGWLWLTLALQGAGFAGLLLWPDSAAHACAVLLGAGLGGCFALTMVVVLDHLTNPVQAGSLSALMQGGGFFIAAFAPWLIAALHDVTGGFQAGWIVHLVFVAAAATMVTFFKPQDYARVMRAPGAR